MQHAIPISASSHGPVPPPVNHLIADVSWVTATGELAKDLGSFPVENGIALYDGPPLESGLYWAIRIRRSGTPGAYFRSGPLRRLPGSPPPLALAGTISFVLSPVGFSLTEPNSDGLPEIVTQQLQNLPAPLEFEAVQLGADNSGNYIVTLRGRLRVVFFSLSFVYRRAWRLVGSVDPGRPVPPVLAEPVGSAAVSGSYLLPYTATLDQLIKQAVERQLEAAVRWIATLDLEIAGASFAPQTVSVSELRVFPYTPGGAAEASMRLGSGAITGVVAPPTLGPLHPA